MVDNNDELLIKLTADVEYFWSMENKLVLQEVSKELGIIVNEKGHSFDKQILAEKIDQLINTDFQKLVLILYRMDVSEIKLKQLLNENPGTDAALIITDLMIERQEQKMISRQKFRKKDENISDDEKWWVAIRTYKSATQQKLNSSNVVGEIIISSQTSGPSLSLYLLFHF